MIEPGEIYKHFKVRDTITGHVVWVLGGDTRYTLAKVDTLDGYRADPDGEFFLVRFGDYPRGYLLRPSEADPVEGGQYHPDHIAGQLALQLQRSYDGSWREYADTAAEAGAV